MTTVDDILKHDRKGEEDFYGLLGCDESATVSHLINILDFCFLYIKITGICSAANLFGNESERAHINTLVTLTT